MDHGSDKWLFPVAAELQCRCRAPLAAIYCMIGSDQAREAKHIWIDALKPREALLEVLCGTYTDSVVEPDRVTHPIDAARRIADAVPVRRLAYPWLMGSLLDVRNAILADARDHK